MNITKILDKNKRLLIISGVLVIISIFMYIGIYYLNSKRNYEVKDYNELIANYEDKENDYVLIDIASEPYEFAEETKDNYTRNYYFVFDKNNYMYMVRLTDTTYNEIQEGYKENPDNFSYELRGYIFNADSELKKIAIDVYNEGRDTNLITLDNFRDYLGNTYLDETLTPSTNYEAILGFFGIWFDILAIIIFILYLVRKIQITKEIKKYGKEQIEFELSSIDTLSYEKFNVYLTNLYVISTISGINIIPYTDIIWLYIEKRRYNGVSTGMSLIGATKKTKYPIASTYNRENELIEIMAKIKEKNPNIMIGFTKENINKYKEIKKKS